MNNFNGFIYFSAVDCCVHDWHPTFEGGLKERQEQMVSSGSSLQTPTKDHQTDVCLSPLCLWGTLVVLFDLICPQYFCCSLM